MDIRNALKDREKKSYAKMSRGRRLELAIELSEFVLMLKGRVKKANGKRVQGDSGSIKRG